jgi:glycosyltransferase involved in cell wall biosynthesis
MKKLKIITIIGTRPEIIKLSEVIKELDKHKYDPDLSYSARKAIRSIRDFKNEFPDKLIFNVTVPAKLQAYLCTKKPILGMLNGEGAQIIDVAKCGFSVYAGDSIGLAKKIIEMYEMNVQERINLGANGFSFYEDNFTLNKCIDNLEIILKNKL